MQDQSTLSPHPISVSHNSIQKDIIGVYQLNIIYLLVKYYNPGNITTAYNLLKSSDYPNETAEFWRALGPLGVICKADINQLDHSDWNDGNIIIGVASPEQNLPLTMMDNQVYHQLPSK
jgi:hypothetical protein